MTRLRKSSELMPGVRNETFLASLARSHTESAISVLHRIMTSPHSPEAMRIRAAEILLDPRLGQVGRALCGRGPGWPAAHEDRPRIRPSRSAAAARAGAPGVGRRVEGRDGQRKRTMIRRVNYHENQHRLRRRVHAVYGAAPGACAALPRGGR